MQDKEINQDNVTKLLHQLQIGVNARDVYRSSTQLQDSGQPGNGADQVFINIYKKCQYRGLSFQLDPEEFLDSCLRLSTLLFRYGRAIEAENYLRFLRELSNSVSLPSWVWAYSAKLEYLRNIELCVQHPTLVLDYLVKAFERDPGNRQALAILSEFTIDGLELLNRRGDIENAKKLSQKIEEISCDLEKEQYSAISQLIAELLAKQKSIEPLSEIEPKFILIEDNNIDLQLRILARENELEELKSLLGSKDEQLRTLQARLIEFESTAPSNTSRTELNEPSEPIAKSTNLQFSLSDAETIPNRSRILVIGGSRVDENHLLGICKSFGVKTHQVRFHLDYYAFNELDINSLAYDNKVAGILVGPLPHKVPGCDDPANYLINTQGYPPTIKIKTNSGELKISKGAFRSALNTLLIKISSDYATTVNS